MRSIPFAGTLLALVGVVVLLRAEERATSAGTPQRVDALVKQLGDARFAVREKAQRELEAIGPAALEPLRKAAKSEDQETSHRASEAVQRIDAAVLATRLLEPKRVSLNLKDTPVNLAVATLVRVSGYPIYIAPGSHAALTRRRITLATGNVPFWEAFDALCASGKLDEDTQSTAPVAFPASIQENQKSRIVVLEGNRAVMPTCYAGAVRIRVLPPSEGTARNHSWAADETLLFLEVSPEPTLQRFSVNPGVSLRQACDDQGQRLALIADEARMESGGLGEIGARQLVTVRLKLGNKRARSLKTLEGVITARTLTLPEPVVEVEDILKAAGRTVKGKYGGALEVVAIDQGEAGGMIQLQVRMTNLAKDNPLANLFPVGRRGVRVQQVVVQGQQVIQIGPGRGMRQRIVGAYDSPLPSLVDARGTPLQLARVPLHQMQMTDAGLVEDATLLFRPLAGQANPVRLVLNGQRLVTLPIAFHLADVPLP